MDELIDSRLRGLVTPFLAALVVFVILMVLGFWQLERLEWKEALIARVAALREAPPIPAPGPRDWPDLENAGFEYRPVSVTGHFLHQYEAHVFTVLNRPKGRYGGTGYLVMTPLETADGWYVYVNRGFVPEDRKYATMRPAGQIDAEVTVTGLFRAPRGATWLSPEDDLTQNVWFSRDPGQFAAWRGPPAAWVAPYIIDAGFDPDLTGGLPQGGETIVEFSNNHFGYALTWFGLAACLVGVFVAFVRARLKRS